MYFLSNSAELNNLIDQAKQRGFEYITSSGHNAMYGLRNGYSIRFDDGEFKVADFTNVDLAKSIGFPDFQ